MKRYCQLYLMMALLVSCLFAQDKKSVTIAVLDFEGKGVKTTDASILADRFRNELVNTKSVTVIERAKMNSILEEIGFQQSGCTTSECLIEVGKLLNVQNMIGATVGKFSNVYTIDLRMIDVETGEILSSISEDHEGAMADLLKKMPNLAQRMAAYALGTEFVEEEEGGNFWLWTTVGVVAAGAAVAVLSLGSDSKGGGSDNNLPLPPAKP